MKKCHNLKIEALRLSQKSSYRLFIRGTPKENTTAENKAVSKYKERKLTKRKQT